MSSINPDSIWVLSALDKFMADNKNKPQIFIALFQKKKTIIDLLQSMKIDSKKYKTIVAKAYKEDSGDLKKCAESDLLKCKDGKSDEMVELWFRQMIQNTGAPYEEQEKLYKKYLSAADSKSSIHKSEVSGNANLNPSTNSSQNIIDSLVSFKSIDDLLEKNENNKDYYNKLLQRKQKLLTLVKSKALTAEKYKSTLQTYITKTTNEDLKSDYKFELDGIEDFHDGNVALWFKEIIEETNDKLQQQIQNLSSKPKPIQKGKPTQPKQNPIMDKQMKQLQVQKSTTSKQAKSFDINSLTSFKIFDDLLQQLTGNKQRYRQLLNKKKKYLDLVSKGALTAEKYRTLLSTAIKQSKNQQIKEGMEFEYSELQEFHNNNVQQWFKDLVSSSEQMLEDQEAIVQKLEKGEKIKPKDESDDIVISDDQDILIDSDDEKNVKKQVKKQPTKPQQIKKPAIQQQSKSNKQGKLGINPGTIFSLKALDQFMSEYQKDAQTFCICFQRKQAIFNMMKNGSITPEKYKQLQETTLKSTTNQKLKQVVEMDLFDLKDMCDNNVMEWFQSLVNDAGFSYQEQQARYQKLKSSGPKKAETKQLVKPNIAEVVCFTVVSLLFDYCQKTMDIVYYRELITKRERLIELVSQKKLISSKYRQINKATFSKTDNHFLRDTINDEEKLLSQKFNGNQDAWFQEIFQNISNNPPQLKLPENEEMKKVNSWPVDKKKKYLICRMSVYQSLVKYYANNNLPSKNNKYILEYQKFKKQDATKALQQLQKNSELDIYNIAQQLFPPITENIFYGGSLSDQKLKVDKICQLFLKEIAAIKDYSGKIKKSTNPENLQICKKQIAKCEQNKKYLKSWPKNELVGFPRIKQQKVEKYNLDIIRYLDKNEIEVEITNIQGVNQHLILKIFVANNQYPRFYAQAKSGPQNTIKTIAKLPNKDMIDIYKGDKKLIIFRLYQKGFFGGLSLVGENAVETNFIRNNIMEQRVQVGKALLSYILRLQKPSKPLITEIAHYQMTILPPFQNDPKVEEEMIKKYMSIK